VSAVSLSDPPLNVRPRVIDICQLLCQSQKIWFMDGEISCVGVSVGDCFFSKGYLKTEKPKNVKFGTKVVSSTKMMHALRARFLEKVFVVQKMAFWPILVFFCNNVNFSISLGMAPHIRRNSVYTVRVDSRHPTSKQCGALRTLRRELKT